MRYTLVCAPGGSGLKHAMEDRLRPALENRGVRVAHEDVEEILRSSAAIGQALEGVVPRNRLPTMRDVTWNLTRHVVIAAWRMALDEALRRLETADADIRLLSCHFTLYGGRRREFYSPVDLVALRQGTRHKIDRVLLLIDDILDMYARLTEPRHLYDPQYRLDLHLQEVWEEERRDGSHDFPDRERAFLDLEWRIGVLATLVGWRHSDMLTAEGVARQLESRYTAYGVKHLTEVTVDLLTDLGRKDVYLSHPISRPRRQWRATGDWPPVVQQFNRLHRDLSERGLNCIMPTAIDEYRMTSHPDGPMALRRPQLDRRWPLPAQPEQLLYSRPDIGSGPEHEWLLSPTDGRPDEEDERWSELLRSLENLISVEVPFRDHHLVASNGGLLVFRPLYEEGKVSGGVAAEIEHWGALAQTDDGRRAVFIHFEEDMEAFAQLNVGPEAARANFNADVARAAQSEVQERFGYAPDRAKRLVESAMAGHDASSLLDQGLGPETQDVLQVWPGIVSVAQGSVIRERLVGAPVPPNQVGIFVAEDEPALQSLLDNIASFLDGQANPPTEWEETVLRIILGHLGE